MKISISSLGSRVVTSRRAPPKNTLSGFLWQWKQRSRFEAASGGSAVGVWGGLGGLALTFNRREWGKGGWGGVAPFLPLLGVGQVSRVAPQISGVGEERVPGGFPFDRPHPPRIIELPDPPLLYFT